jgi:hypothetical protein
MDGIRREEIRVRFPTRDLAVPFCVTKIDSGIHPALHTMRAEFSSAGNRDIQNWKRSISYHELDSS